MEPTADRLVNTAQGSKNSPPSLAVRLSLVPYQAVAGGLDGAWWPRSHDLVVELPSLIEAMDGVGSITRVTLGIEEWSHIPHQVASGGHMVGAGWFASGREQNVILSCSYRQGFRSLLVIPPGTGADAAAWLLNTPVPADGSSTATEHLATANSQLCSGT
ncbi:DUF5994 family protein [Streptomyces sp. NPDC127036]|uniref:DUF5994 family protein n=1 Tax=unclassified Streptomyces TaxID=2593676 RepID=UPI003650A162